MIVVTKGKSLKNSYVRCLGFDYGFKSFLSSLKSLHVFYVLNRPLTPSPAISDNFLDLIPVLFCTHVCEMRYAFVIYYIPCYIPFALVCFSKNKYNKLSKNDKKYGKNSNYSLIKCIGHRPKGVYRCQKTTENSHGTLKIVAQGTVISPSHNLSEWSELLTQIQ